MNILLSFLQDKGGAAHNIPGYRFWLHYLKNGIKEAGMQCTEIPGADWAEGLVHQKESPELLQWKDITWSSTLDYIRNSEKKIDLFLCYLYPHQIDVGAIKQIQLAGIPCVNFYCDNIRHFERVPDEFKIFDLLWVPEYEAIPMYKKANIKFLNLPMPMWIDHDLRETFTPTENPAISFIGSKDVLREKLLSKVIDKGLEVLIQGSGWLPGHDQYNIKEQSAAQKLLNQFTFVKEHGLEGLGRKLSQQIKKTEVLTIPARLILPQPNFTEYISIIKNSSITLGINRVPSFKRPTSNPLKYSRLRDIEAPMLGACYLTEYCAGIAQLYDTQREIYTYNDENELIEKARELLHNPAKRKELRANSQKKALNEYSIPASLQKIKKAIV